MTPYIIAFERAVHSRTHKRVVLVISSQSGKTEGLFDIIGERLDTSPVPIIYLGPSKSFLEEQLEPRIVDLLENTPLREKMAAKSRQRKTKKTVNGVPIRLAHGGSSTAMKSDPFGLAVSDEVDELMSNVKGAGNPIELIDMRGDTYSDFVHAAVSTPSEGNVEVEIDPESGLAFWAEADPDEVKSTIWRLWQSGTRYHWAWPCPDCNEYFIPRFSCLEWDKPVGPDGRELPSTPSLARQTAHLVCPCCGSLITEGDNGATKAWMNERGVYVAPGQSVTSDGIVQGLPPESWTLSYWVSGLASPFVSWGERAARYVAAVRSGDPQTIRAVKNGGFGELYSPGGGAAPEWNEVKNCSIDYRMGQVPDLVQVLTLTCDVQQDRLYTVIRGWGAYASSALITAETLYGRTDETEVWDDLHAMLTDYYDGLPIRLALIDSGFRPGKPFIVPEHKVYDFVRRFPRGVFATKGSSSPMRKPIMKSPIDVKVDGKLVKGGIELLRLDTDYFKSWVQQKISADKEAPGRWVLPEDISDDYCKQIVSEARITAPGLKTKWVQKSKDNHFFDCEAMQAAAAVILNLQKLRDESIHRERAAKVSPVQKRPAPRRPTGGGFLGDGSIW